jgi:hypothetical protein
VPLTTPGTANVLAAIQAKAQALQVNSATFFASSSVIIGKAKDIPDLVPLFEVTLADDNTQRFSLPGGYTQGGQIDDSQHFLCEITLDNTDSETVESTTLPGIRDSFTEAFHTSIQLGLAGQVADSRLIGQGKYGYTLRNNVWWRAYKQILKVRYEYYVIPTA